MKRLMLPLFLVIAGSLNASGVGGNNQFALDLYQRVAEPGKNVFFSPYSISAAMMMAYEGARDFTAHEIGDVFHFASSKDEQHRTYRELYGLFNKKDAPYKLYLANALWLRQGLPLLHDYTSALSRYYSSKINEVDFVGATEHARKTINTWVEKQTHDKIKNLIPTGAVNAATQLVLTNAIYFKGDWAKQFDKTQTQKEPFWLMSDTHVDVNMMGMSGDKARFNYAEDNDAQVLELPYKGDVLSMLIILPRGSLKVLEQSLTVDQIDQWRRELRNRRVDVYVPKFKLDAKYFLKNTLVEMGMPLAFEQRADFSGIDGRRGLYISDVIHQAFVAVDEQGTEAAAATAIPMARNAIIDVPEFRADHPFIFIIQDKKTGTILFMGRVSNPLP